MRTWLAIANAIDRFSVRVGRIACWLTLAMVLVASYNTIARYLGQDLQRNLTSNALLEAQWYLFSIVFLLGAAYTLKQDAHVRVDVVYDRLGRKGRAWINLVGSIFFLVPFCLFVLWSSWNPVINSWRVMEVSPDPGGLPRYPIKTLLPIAFALILLQGIASLVRQVAMLRGTHDAEATDRGDAHL